MKMMTAETFVPFGKKPALSAASLARWLAAEGAAAEAVSLPLSLGRRGSFPSFFPGGCFIWSTPAAFSSPWTSQRRCCPTPIRWFG